MSKKILKIGAAGLGFLAGGPIGAAAAYGTTSAGLSAGKAILGGKKSKAADSAPVMPLPDDEAIRQAKRRVLVRQRGRTGRASTILTDGDVLGG
ncbi:hypothetical protein GG804_25025 [Sphingomonas histidinilytica]|uniref:hypothetical protein n=1 Tax=Rhizorhabdus histidinilytica TaxID=439228 RepID=UPI001ADBDE06|nr:hypothetical protein [Rhizorhabdus histidinilytica]MBO9380035.1 hypothetical protein [Rhizorhabdus histidinilytica]